MKTRFTEFKNASWGWFFIMLFILSFRAQAQDKCIPIGWASQNGGTTGGGAATPVTVTTLSALQTQASSTGAKVIYVSGTMGAGVGTRVVVSSNKTIFGLPGATLSGGFDVKNASNVIIRNMIVKGPGAIDVDGVDCITVQNSTNVWVDHCDISDGQDGNFDIVDGSNYVSVTWTKFSYTSASVAHQFCNLLGNSDTKTSDRGKIKVTMMFNYWTTGCVERMPRVRFGQVHVVNNLFDSPEGKYCVRAGLEADILVEGNAFVGVTIPVDLYQNDFTAVTVRNNSFASTNGNILGSGTSFTPPYSLSMIAASTVSAKVKPCVGATLTTPSVCPCATALPVELIDFQVEPFQKSHLLRWTFGNSGILKKTIIEYSENGNDYQPLETMDSYADHFIFHDEILSIHSIIYIRLKFEDEDGSFTYSPVRTIQSENIYSIYPNPFTNEITITNAAAGYAAVYGLDGNIVFEKNISESEKINLDHLLKGFYIVSITEASTNKITRIKLTKL